MKKIFLYILGRLLIFLICLELFFYVGAVVSRQYHDIKNKIKFQSSSAITVLCMGDSITFAGAEYSYPNQLESYLNQHSDRKFKVINLAEAGKGSDYMASSFNNWIKTYKPDYVIMMAGLFDSGLEMQEENTNWFAKLNVVKTLQALIQRKLSVSDQKEAKSNSVKTNKKAGVKQSDTFQEAMAKMPANYQKLFMYAAVLRLKGVYKEEGNIYRALLNVPDLEKVIKDKLYRLLGESLWEQKKYGEYAQVMEHIPHFSWPADWVETICFDQERRAPLVAMLEQKLQEDIKDHFSYDLLHACYMEASDQENIDRLVKMKGNKNYQSVSLRTKKNYAYILDILKSTDINVVMVQYPLRKLSFLKSLVRDSDIYDRIIFVDNYGNFTQALEDGEYKEFFTDRAAARFGHGTQKGNRLIAESIGKAILHQ